MKLLATNYQYPAEDSNLEATVCLGIANDNTVVLILTWLEL